MILIFCNLFLKTEAERKLLNLSYEVRITKSEKEVVRKKSHRSVSLMDIDAKKS
jgi:hypothetical protein